MSILDIFKKTPPKTSKVNSKLEKQPIEVSKETDKALTDARHGAIGAKSGGYDNKKPYSAGIKK
jgi:hypothetical protein